VDDIHEKPGAHCTNGFLERTDQTSPSSVSEIKGRFRPSSSQVVSVPSELKLYEEKQLTLHESYLMQALKVVGFCLHENQQRVNALHALHAIQLRACLDLMPRVLMVANALLHKFDSESLHT
jgi:hypothetical protein